MVNKLSLLLIAMLVALYIKAEYTLSQCEELRAEQAAAFQKAMAEADRITIRKLEALRARYAQELRDVQAAKSSVTEEYERAVSAIHDKAKKDEEYRVWSEQPIPAIVVKRLQQLPETRNTD